MEKFKLAKLVEKPTLDERWYIEFNYRHPETGKFKSPAFRTFISQKLKTKEGRRKKGYEIRKEINSKLQRGWNPYQESERRFTSVSEAIDFALQLKKPSLRKRSYETYKNVVTTFKKFLNEKNYNKIECDKFTYYQAQEYLDWILITLQVSNRTYNNYLRHTRTFFYLLEKREYVSHNPFKNIDFLEEEEAEIICFTKYELSFIKSTLPDYDPELFLISMFIFYCFIRLTELTRLRISDIDMVNRVIKVPGHASKNKKFQTVVIPDQLYSFLELYNLHKYPRHYFVASTSLKPGANSIAGQRISERWKKYSTEYDLDPRKTIYKLKHTAVGMAVESGINVRDLQLQLRHASLEETQVYIEKFNKIGGDDIRHNYPTF